MKTSTKILTLSLALAAVLGLAGLASAQNHMMGGAGMMNGGNGMMYGHGMAMPANLPPEKQAAVQKLYNDFNAATGPVRQQLYAKQAELNALYYGGTPDTKKYQALSREVADLNAKLYEAQANLRGQLAKEGVPASAMGMGGHHMGGAGMGAGCI
ncbi:MAG TPA: periplasmic heavy metal sensor [Humidesulfovibrio sp.]|uniref:periplasmic heavy metal sensor n=1 Tax=Humidesulfovibrio sp. TaxID=2910988 RepID=UPI002C9958F4|nr:periplasmic heavy metal sensor [Humidesulfovibrio sp.]HWR05142.1 periplasmic heavy metal sensor [Humidesulfovibrio sp.]